MSEFVEQDMDGNFDNYFRDTGNMAEMETAGTRYTDIKEDLYILLVEKTEGEAMSRLRGCQIGNGIQTYMVLYKWFMGASGQAIADRVKRLMSPTPPKTEQDIADAIEKWSDSAKILENMRAEYKLPDFFNVTALETLMSVGQAKLYFESIKGQGYDFEDMLQKCKDYGMRRRLDHMHKNRSDDMDIGAVQDGGNTPEEEWEMGGQERYWEEDWYMDTDAMGKSKGKGATWMGKGATPKGSWMPFMKGKGKAYPKGKGKGDKGKGKGPTCHKCGHPGHLARDCPDPNPFQGYCTACGA